MSTFATDGTRHSHRWNWGSAIGHGLCKYCGIHYKRRIPGQGCAASPLRAPKDKLYTAAEVEARERAAWDAAREYDFNYARPVFGTEAYERKIKYETFSDWKKAGER